MPRTGVLYRSFVVGYLAGGKEQGKKFKVVADEPGGFLVSGPHPQTVYVL